MKRAARDLLALAVFGVLVFGAAALGSIWTQSSVDTWYVTLAKPEWTPPGSVIGSVWSVLFVLMAVSAWLVWREEGIRGARVPLSLFAFQLVLNAAWSGIFFGLQNPGAAFIEIIALWLAIVATIIAFARVSRTAALLLVPYLAWVTFAGYLTWAIWRLNA